MAIVDVAPLWVVVGPRRGGAMPSELLREGLPLYAAFLFSASVHEAAHAWAAKRGGDLTAYHGGQVTFDPRPHIRREPVGLVFLPLLFLAHAGWPLGFASAPYDPAWARRLPHRAAWMALAGPAANLALLGLAALFIYGGVAAGALEAPARVSFSTVTVATAPGAWNAIATLLSVFFSMNLVLFLLNMIPFPPLDGSGAVGLFMSESAALRWQDTLRRPALGWVGLAAAWFLFPSVFREAFAIALRLLYSGTL